MTRCLISLGANLGDSASAMAEAIGELRQRFEQVSLSRIYRTPAIGGPGGQDAFLNAIAAVETNQEVWQAWNTIREIERQMGRQRQHRWEARRIDLDILLHGQSRIWTTDLKVPHPRMCMRRFVLEPALEVAADWLDPVSGWTIAQLAHNLRFHVASVLLLGESLDRSIAIGRQSAAASGANWLGASPPVGLPNWGQNWVAADDLPWWRKVTDADPAGQEAVSDNTQHPFFSIVYPVLSGASAGQNLTAKPLSADDLPGVKLGNLTRTASSQSPTYAASSAPISAPTSDSVTQTKASAFGVESKPNLAPRLVIVLADVGDPARHDWEIAVGPWADWLRLRPSDETSVLNWNGPRYLLAADDPNWASHEVEAALQAMNCELEVVEGIVN